MENKKMFAENEVNEVKNESKTNDSSLKAIGMIVGGVIVGKFVYKKVIKPRLVNGLASLMREAQEQIDDENSKK